MIPEVDAAGRDRIDETHAKQFLDAGVLVLRNVLHPGELSALRDQTLPLIERAAATRVDDPDYAYGSHDGVVTASRIEYVIDKLPACKALLGHPFILRTVELLQGRNFVPTWDSCVFKLPGAGVAVPWHYDDAGYDGLDVPPVFNVDFYLDTADETNCLWVFPGSQHWPVERSRAKAGELNAGGFGTEDAVAIHMAPGDVLLHNARALHGSAASSSELRRVVYYEFRAGEAEREHGPHTVEYIPLKQRVLLACLRRREQAPYAAAERPFVYRPEGAFAVPDDEEPGTYRYAHEQHWRTG